MRAPIIVVILAVVAGRGYYFYQGQHQPAPATTTAVNAAQPATMGPATPLIALVNDVCVEGREGYAQTEQRLIAAGWAAAPDSVHPSIARIMAFSRGAMTQTPASDIRLQAYANPQRQEYFILTGMVLQGHRANGCYVYDFDATQLPDVGVFESRLGAPTEVESQSGVIEGRKWRQPAAMPTLAALHVALFPAGSPAEPELGFHGVMGSTTFMPEG